MELYILMDPLPLIRILADGRFHSGDKLGRSLGVSRAAIWKIIRQIESRGLEIHSVRGKGYRLSAALELLDRSAIVADLRPEHQRALDTLDILATVDSTNSLLMRKLQSRELQQPRGVHVCLAEQQTAGRGRRGRQWISPFGRNMYLSVLKVFATGIIALEGLSLAVAIAVARALADCGIADIAVKWPNDVLWQNQKLAGILLEMTGDINGECQVVIGIGLNLETSRELVQNIEQPWTDLASISGQKPARNRIVARVLDNLLQVIGEFERNGFGGFRQEWESLDACRGLQVELTSANAVTTGVVRGVSDQGALVLETENEVRLFNGGEVSMRVNKAAVTGCTTGASNDS
ncbi:MAG: bifunctional biotin--[acetyl-CoA-carboxylase] ligase/biotin operon repressor BirA [Pseudohongiellaceae bacterium]